MELVDLLNYKNVSQYRLSKLSKVPQSTISDICSNKTSIEKCSILTLYKIANALCVSIEDFLIKQCDKISPEEFDVFKSSICHYYKSLGAKQFINKITSSKEIENFYKNKEYAKSFYLVAMVDYATDSLKLPRIEKYDFYRSFSLLEPLYPKSVVVLDEVLSSECNKKESLESSLEQFKKFNIIENDIENIA